MSTYEYERDWLVLAFGWVIAPFLVIAYLRHQKRSWLASAAPGIALGLAGYLSTVKSWIRRSHED